MESDILLSLLSSPSSSMDIRLSKSMSPPGSCSSASESVRSASPKSSTRNKTLFVIENSNYTIIFDSSHTNCNATGTWIFVGFRALHEYIFGSSIFDLVFLLINYFPANMVSLVIHSKQSPNFLFNFWLIRILLNIR